MADGVFKLKSQHGEMFAKKKKKKRSKSGEEDGVLSTDAVIIAASKENQTNCFEVPYRTVQT